MNARDARAVADWKLFQRDFKEISRDVELLKTRPIPLSRNGPVSGRNKPYSTTVIAAMNTQSADRQNADFACDGFADNVEIQYALSRGGRVLLLDGVFVLNDSVFLLNNVIIEGMGMESTTLQMDGDFAHTSGGDISNVGIRGILFTGPQGRGVELDVATRVRIEGCSFVNTSHGIWFGESNDSVVHNCTFRECGIKVGPA